MKNELLILQSKKRFIEDVIEDNIKIHKRKKEEIILDLRNKEYPQVESGKVLTSYDTKSTTNKYDYLIRMSIYSFTEDEIEKLIGDITKLQNEYDILLNRKIEDIWLEECNIFLKNYKKMKLKC